MAQKIASNFVIVKFTESFLSVATMNNADTRDLFETAFQIVSTGENYYLYNIKGSICIKL